MKDTHVETYGNNVPSKHIKRILIPLFTQENSAPIPGLKYFFPENPQIDKKDIVGIEAHLTLTPLVAIGDVRDSLNNIISQEIGKTIYLVLYDQDNSEIFYNFPLRSLFTFMPLGFVPATRLTKRIKPIACKLKTRSCYAYIPANALPEDANKLYISLSIYYN
jgi:hypothetical protein